MSKNQFDLYLSTTFYKDYSSVCDVLKHCTENEIYHLELGSNHVYEDDLASIIQRYPCQYLVHNYFPIPKEGFIVNIASLNDDLYERSVSHVFAAIDFCNIIGAKLYTFHPGFLSDPIGSSPCSSNYDFQFKAEQIPALRYEKAFDRMLCAVKRIVAYAYEKNVRIAVETEGSVLHKNHLLMQYPEEFSRFFDIFSPQAIGINLNIGHLRLASNAYGFEIIEFINLVAEYIVAMELSHNGGGSDEHLPLVDGEWYWDVIFDQRFANAYKILEFRNTSIEDVLRNIKLVAGIFNNLRP